MLSPQLNGKCCSDSNINNLLIKIDNVVQSIATALLNNIRYGLTDEISEENFYKLISYKNIIIKKYLGNDSLSNISWDKLSSKIKKILNKY